VIRAITVLLLLFVAPAWSEELNAFEFTQRQGAALPLGAVLTDETGQSAPLGAFLAERPAILALGYFHCPNLCGVVREDVFNALGATDLKTPRDYTLLAISIDPSERPADAAAAKADALARYATDGAGRGWHFLTGAAPAIQQVEQAVGFHARYDNALRQFLHPSGLVFATSAGTVAGYLLGVGYQPGDVRAAIARAAQGREAAALPVLLLCFHFDPSTGRYSLAILKVLQLGAVLTVLTIAGMLALLRRRSR
jgi:protein SCO1/2